MESPCDWSLFPEIEARNSGFLQVSDLHSLYYEETGNPNGFPVIFLHGGPGAGIGVKHRRFFDPDFYRIILLDQRGSGKSIPYAELKDNTTWDLVEDIEKLREHLGVDRWLVFGGSWGSTLALAYSVTYPERVSGIILRGIFLCRDWEVQWFYQDGASHLYPELWDEYTAVLSPEEKEDIITAYYKRLTSEDHDIRYQAAVAWSTWETLTSKLLLDLSSAEECKEEAKSMAIARIECHYFVNHGFFPSQTFLLEQAASKLGNIPIRIVQGRYDIICPIQTAYELKHAVPHAEMVIVPNAGHSAFEKGITSELVHATEDFKQIQIM